MGLFDSGGVGVKICGITRPEDARMCVSAGADALGFNFYSASKRYVDLNAFEWIRDLDGQVERVAVVVNGGRELLSALTGSGCFEAIQFHGDESPEECEASGAVRWIKALRMKAGDPVVTPEKYATRDFLIDAWSPTEYGGTGLETDRALAMEVVKQFPDKRFALAGGLTPSNVAGALRIVQPAAVDVAGGVESAPGVKCPRLVEEFIQAVRSAQG